MIMLFISVNNLFISISDFFKNDVESSNITLKHKDYVLAQFISQNKYVSVLISRELNYYNNKMENEINHKSIIYGNTFENKYGKFMPICSSILDRCTALLTQRLFKAFWITSRKLRTSKSLTAFAMLTELMRYLLSSLQRKRMSTLSITKAAIVIRLWKALDKSFSTCFLNLVILRKHRHQKCAHYYAHSTV